MDVISGLSLAISGAFLAQFAHSQVFQNAFLDILQAKVILVEHLTGMGNIQIIGCVISDQGRDVSQSR